MKKIYIGVEKYSKSLNSIVTKDRHPCIICWTYLNRSIETPMTRTYFVRYQTRCLCSPGENALALSLRLAASVVDRQFSTIIVPLLPHGNAHVLNKNVIRRFKEKNFHLNL